MEKIVVFRKKDLEGYVMLDNRESPGFTYAEHPAAYHAGIPVGPGAFFEGSTLKCRCCDRIVVLNPDRIRERGHCRECDGFLCDPCAVNLHLTGNCNCIDKLLDKALKAQATILVD